MATVKIETVIEARIERCFDAAQDIDLHMKSVSYSGEKAIAGKTSGLIGANETVTWQAKHFGIRQKFTSKITAFEPPKYFQDRMIRGAFRFFVHDHFFRETNNVTIMTDVLEFQSPFGPIGRLVDILITKRYLRRLLEMRSYSIKRAAESDI